MLQILPNGRNLVFTITETCRRSHHEESILDLLIMTEKNKLMLMDSSEDDIMPFVAECVEKNNLYLAQPVIAYLLQNNMKCSARLFSILLKGEYINQLLWIVAHGS